MTTQLPSKERLEHFAEFGSERLITPINDFEVIEMARALLAAYEQEPVAYDQKQRDLMNNIVAKAMENNLERGDKLVMADVFAATMALMKSGFRTHPAPSIPAAVPDFDTIALTVARDIMCDVNRRHEFLGGDIQLLSRIQCRIDDAIRAALGSPGASPR